jgi:hypothetical protein
MPEYNERSAILYGLLRETWEAAVEEKLLNGVIRRHGAEVQTLRLRGVEVTTDMYKAIDDGMSKCSTWMIGHDKSKAQSIDRLPPKELGGDIDALSAFIKDGAIVERKRYERIAATVHRFDSRGKDLRWIYCHLFQPDDPPDEAWTFDETVYWFSRENALHPPLDDHFVVVRDIQGRPGVHWAPPVPE